MRLAELVLKAVIRGDGRARELMRSALAAGLQFFEISRRARVRERPAPADLKTAWLPALVCWAEGTWPHIVRAGFLLTETAFPAVIVTSTNRSKT